MRVRFWNGDGDGQRRVLGGRSGLPVGLPAGLPVGLVLLAAVVGVLGGCGVNEELVSMRDRAREVEAGLVADRAELVGLVESLPEQDPARARVEMMARQRAQQAEAFGDAGDRLEALISAAESGDVAGTMETGAGAVLPLLPPGAQVPALLAVGLAASVWRAVRLKSSAVSIAKGLETAMREDEQLREGVKRNAATLRAEQTPTARRIVDEATKPQKMVRLPL